MWHYTNNKCFRHIGSKRLLEGILHLWHSRCNRRAREEKQEFLGKHRMSFAPRGCAHSKIEPQFIIYSHGIYGTVTAVAISVDMSRIVVQLSTQVGLAETFYCAVRFSRCKLAKSQQSPLGNIYIYILNVQRFDQTPRQTSVVVVKRHEQTPWVRCTARTAQTFESRKIASGLVGKRRRVRQN